MKLIHRFLPQIIVVQVLITKCLTHTENLRAVAMITRHGDRAPFFPYPTDPYKNFEWPNGFGQLSPRGVKQMFESGLIKALRYSTLFDPLKDRHKVQVRSSSAFRCVNSTFAFLEGFMQPPIPDDMVNIVAANEDTMLSFPGQECPKYPFMKILGELDPNEEESLVLKQISDYTQLNATSLSNLLLIYDALEVQLSNNLEVPNWVEPFLFTYLQPLLFKTFDQLTTSDYLKIRSGVLLNDIIDMFENRLTGKSDKEILLYSGHDVTIDGLAFLLGVQPQLEPFVQFGATLAIELQARDATSDSVVDVKILYFRNHADKFPLAIKLHSCDDPCSFEDFKNVMKPKIVKSYDWACALHNGM